LGFAASGSFDISVFSVSFFPWLFFDLQALSGLRPLSPSRRLCAMPFPLESWRLSAFALRSLNLLLASLRPGVFALRSSLYGLRLAPSRLCVELGSWRKLELFLQRDYHGPVADNPDIEFLVLNFISPEMQTNVRTL